MLTDRIFVNALIVSIIFHIFFFFKWPPLRSLAILKPKSEIKLTYYPSIKQAPVVSERVAEKDIIKKALPAPAPMKTAPATGSDRRELAKPALDSKSPDALLMEVPRMQDKGLIRHVSSDEPMLISHKDKDYSNEPSYLTYYNAVRSKIYEAANANKPYYFMEGEVKLIFTLSRDGSLLNLAIVQEASTTNPILQRHALMSIKRPSPFPPFQEPMKEDHLTLRITISFEK